MHTITEACQLPSNSAKKAKISPAEEKAKEGMVSQYMLVMSTVSHMLSPSSSTSQTLPRSTRRIAPAQTAKAQAKAAKVSLARASPDMFAQVSRM